MEFKVSAEVVIFLVALICFKDCRAQGDTDMAAVTSSSPYEVTIWTEGILKSADAKKFDQFSLQPSASAALLSHNIVITAEDASPTADPGAGVFSATAGRSQLFAGLGVTDFHRLTRIHVPALVTDAKDARIALFKVSPPFELQGLLLKPILLSANKTAPEEQGTISEWMVDDKLYSAGRKVLDTAKCPNDAVYFCVNKRDGDNTVPAEGGLLVCNGGQLCGLFSSKILPDKTLVRSYLDVAPFRQRVLQLVAEHASPAPGLGLPTPTTSLPVLVAALLASRRAWRAGC